MTGEIAWPQLAAWGPTLVMLALVLAFLLKIAPTWKEIKLRELSVREAEANARSEQAAALSQLGTGVSQMSGTLKDVAVEQRRATDSVKILQRVGADTADQMVRQMAIITDRVERIERGRENHVEPEGSGTKAH
jgi:methyl-accepting chemotaxis protein